MKINKLTDARTMGQISKGVPLIVEIICNDQNGNQFEGWYHTTDYHLQEPRGYQMKYVFRQTVLSNNKKCDRKVRPSIAKKIASVIENNLHSVIDCAKLMNKTKGEI